MLKKNTLIVALIAALPAMAQEEAMQTPPAPAPHWGAAGEMPERPQARPDMHKRMLEKFDADKDGKLNDAEKEAMKAEFEKRRAERGNRAPRPEGMHPGNRRRPHSERPEMLDKFDTDKDGQLSPEEHKALKEAADKHREERRERFHAEFMERFDADKDGQLSEEEKEAAKAARGERRGPKGKRGPRRPRGERPEGMPMPPAEAPTTLEL